MLAASPNIRMLLIPFAGLPETTKEIMGDYPQIVIHTLHHNASPTVEMALTLLMAAAKNTLPIDRIFRNHEGFNSVS
ncbi:MAG: hypothetical protein Q9P44_16370 [Anaerolineae bacterium]|nr:hypothetical protein [Anaerolineae bacterium]